MLRTSAPLTSALAITNMPANSIREHLTTEERCLPLESTMDPGFVHKRKIATILGPQGMGLIDELTTQLPDLPGWQREVRIDHIYSEVFLKFCEIQKIKSLTDIVHDRNGHLFCSTERFAPCESIYEVSRAYSIWVPPEETDLTVRLEYSTAHIASDTLRSRLHQGARLAIVAEFREAYGTTLVFEPILMGFPWVRTEDPAWKDKVMWWGGDFFEHFVEDFDEFRAVRDTPKPDDISTMQAVSEHRFKEALCKILGEPVPKDWGGETSDLFTSHIHLNGKRCAAAFLLKGPARFAPMGLNHLGKNNDQIVRLSHEPADVLVVQHCHQILAPVKETMRALAGPPLSGPQAQSATASLMGGIHYGYLRLMVF